MSKSKKDKHTTQNHDTSSSTAQKTDDDSNSLPNSKSDKHGPKLKQKTPAHQADFSKSQAKTPSRSADDGTVLETAKSGSSLSEDGNVETDALKEGESAEAKRDVNSDNTSESDQSTASAAPDELAEILGRYKSARQEVDKLKDNLLRMAADFENYKKRDRAENEQRLKFAIQPFAQDIITCIDDLELAIKHIAARDDEANNKAEMVKGLDMSLAKFLAALKSHNIHPIEAAGEAFDPNLHEAMGVVNTEEVPDNHVCEVFKRGYSLHGRVIRAAVVQVAKNNSAT